MKYSIAFFLACIMPTIAHATHSLANELDRDINKPFTSTVSIGVRAEETSTLRITMTNDPLAKDDESIPHLNVFTSDASFDEFFWKTALNGGNQAKIIKSDTPSSNMRTQKKMKVETPDKNDPEVKSMQVTEKKTKPSIENLIQTMAKVKGLYKVVFSSSHDQSKRGVLSFTIESFPLEKPKFNWLILGENVENAYELVSAVKSQLVFNMDKSLMNDPPESMYN